MEINMNKILLQKIMHAVNFIPKEKLYSDKKIIIFSNNTNDPSLSERIKSIFSNYRDDEKILFFKLPLITTNLSERYFLISDKGMYAKFKWNEKEYNPFINWDDIDNINYKAGCIFINSDVFFVDYNFWGDVSLNIFYTQLVNAITSELSIDKQEPYIEKISRDQLGQKLNSNEIFVLCFETQNRKFNVLNEQNALLIKYSRRYKNLLPVYLFSLSTPNDLPDSIKILYYENLLLIYKNNIIFEGSNVPDNIWQVFFDGEKTITPEEANLNELLNKYRKDHKSKINIANMNDLFYYLGWVGVIVLIGFLIAFSKSCN